MLVRETLDACECEVCGISCTGRFANCWRSIFQANGRVVQMRCLPPSIPQSTEAASAEELVEETEPLITGSPAQGVLDAGVPSAGAAGAEAAGAGAAGAFGAGAGAGAGGSAGLREAGNRSEQELAALQHRVSEISGLIYSLSLENSELRGKLASIAARLEAMDSPIATTDLPVRPVTHVIRPTSDSAESFTRPGRAVAHPDVVHRQHRVESHQSVGDELLTHPLAESSGGGLG